MEIKDNKLECLIGGQEVSFPLPPSTNYDEGHHLVIPTGKEFVHVIASAEGWTLGEVVPMALPF